MKLKLQGMLICACASMLILFSCKKEISANENPAPLPTTAQAAPSRPFKAYYITTAQFIQGPAVQIITGRGDASHLGESVFVANATVNFSTPPPFAIAGTAVFTAANGDQFFTQFTGTNTPLGNGISRGVINHTITGGTGRFENASGNLTGVALVNAASPTNSVTYEGTLNY